MTSSVYDAAGGQAGLLRLAHAWHERVMADDVVSHAFSHGFHPEHTERLAAYWAEALGGPRTYSHSIGDETSVVRMHSGNGPHDEMDSRAIACFDQALTDAGFATDDPVRQVLFDYFAWATTTTMARYHDVRRRRARRPGHSPLVVGRAGRELNEYGDAGAWRRQANASSAAWSSSMSAAARFSSRWRTDDVPGMSSTLGATASSQASATCAGLWPRRSAAATTPGWLSTGLSGMKAEPSGKNGT